MTSDTRSVTIDAAVELIIDHRGRTPKKLGGDFSSDGVQVISAKNVRGGHVHLDENRRFVSREMAERWMPNKLRRGDVLLTSEAPLGEAAYLDENADLCLGQRLFALRARPNVVDPHFLYYVLRSPLVQRRLHARATGTTAQGIKQSELRQVELALPPIDKQQRIAAILGALDAKIDSNQRLAALLDQAAATIFRARFVDFVGVEEFDESELGPVPVGWKVAPIGEVVRVVGGSTPSTSEPRFWSGTHCWATPKDLAGVRSPILLDTERHITDEGVNSISSKLLPSRTVLLSSRAPVGYTAISFVEIAVNQGFIAIPQSDSMPSEFVLLWLREHMPEIKAHAGGTTFAEISKRAFRPLPMVVPPAEWLRDFGNIARSLFDLMAAQEAEIRTLSRVRDALLPKLVSGETVVADTADANDVIGPAAEELAVPS